MKIDSDRLRILRKRKGFTRPQLEKLSGITKRTIQRLEREPHQSQKTREDTVIRLAKPLSVEPGVLTGELPLPESDEVPVSDQAPKTRLAYDLIKRRYGVSRTEIVNMAPLFFTLLAEGSLAWRHKKLKEADEAISQLDDMRNEVGHWIFLDATTVAGNASSAEKDSIAGADIFGEHLFNSPSDLPDEPFDPDKDNPFVHYLRKLANKPTIRNVVNVDEGILNIASDFKFPHYEICSEELDHITNGSPDAKRTLETGCARISEIPDELMAEDAGEKRAKWLENKLLDIYKKMDEKSGDMIATAVAQDTSGKWKQFIEKEYSETKKEGDDQ